MSRTRRRSVIAALTAASLAALGLAFAPPALAATATTGPTTFTYVGTWGHTTNSDEFYSNQTNATASQSFNINTAGATVKIRGYKHSGQGIEAISIDGGTETNVDLYASVQAKNATVYTSPGLAVGKHTVKIRVTGTKNAASSGYYASVMGADLSDGTFLTNTAPVVNAGVDKAVTMPNAVTLSGTVTDDGLPKPANLTAAWTKVSGPGVVTFANPAAASTTATFDTAGTYTLRLTGSDGSLTATDDTVITVSPAPVNTAPTVNAGTDQTVTMPNAVTLSGSIADDGLPNPPGTTTAAWTQVSGPGTTTFANSAAASTTATFSVDGAYVLRLTGNDGALASSDDVAVTVNPAAVSGVTLNRDFDTCDYSQWSGNSGLEAGTPSQQSVISSTVTRAGTGCSNKFEIANVAGDKVSNGTYRSLWAQYDSQEGTVGGSDFAYGFSFQTPQVPNYEHIWELHQRANIYSVAGAVSIAPHAILLRGGQLQYREMTGAGVWNGSAWTGYSNYQDQKVLLPTVSANTWYDVIVHIKASEGSDGLTEVFVRQAGQAWPATANWSNAGPSLPYLPGGLDPNVPTKRSTFDIESGTGLSGLYLESGVYSGSTSWGESFSPFDIYIDQLRRYTDIASAKTGFPQ